MLDLEPTMQPALPAPAEIALLELVQRFYDRVRRDKLMGPLFADAVGDWDAHTAKVADFWHAVMHKSGRYKGAMMASHLQHRARIAPEHVARWLELWRDTTAETLSPTQADAFVAKAERIAQSLRLALFFDPACRPENAMPVREGDRQ